MIRPAYAPGPPNACYHSRSRPAVHRPGARHHQQIEVSSALAHSSRTWRGARTPQAMKRVRQSERKRVINQPHKSRSKTLVTKALTIARDGEAEAAQTAVVEAVASLDKAVKAGALHRNTAARRKSRLMLKVNAAIGGATIVSAAKAARTTGKAAAAKAAKARVAASKAAKAKGEQTAAGKARAALSRSTRGGAAAAAGEAPATPSTTPSAAPKTAPKPTTAKPAAKAAAKPSAAKVTPKPTAAKAAAKPTAKAASTASAKAAPKATASKAKAGPKA
ncbi:MAG: 30S ribosomal protein S20 [Candidatus Limnocylindrales bacterium]